MAYQGNSPSLEADLGASYLGEGSCQFLVWAPFASEVTVHLISPREWTVPLARDARGYHYRIVEGITPGARYLYRVNGGEEFPDPASRSQPEGVHGPSEIISPVFPWQDEGWRNIPLKEFVVYELHVGSFSSEGTFDGVITHLSRLKELGVTAVELMPIAQFPGSRNWGYDGVYPFAVQGSYGGIGGLKRLINACHVRGLAVTLDVVYNHLGPEGNYFGKFGPYFTERYCTPWGQSLNFDGPESDEVRRFFIENAHYWLNDCHVDVLRLDALHAMLDLWVVRENETII
jgi:maltooligosyltrehalose trehalohydrolase